MQQKPERISTEYREFFSLSFRRHERRIIQFFVFVEHRTEPTKQQKLHNSILREREKEGDREGESEREQIENENKSQKYVY